MNKKLDSDVTSIRSTATMKGGIRGLYGRKEKSFLVCSGGDYGVKGSVEDNKAKIIAVKAKCFM